jgi:hypothetical protein
MKASLPSAAPRTSSHLKVNLKKQQMQNDYFRDVERDNQVGYAFGAFGDSCGGGPTISPPLHLLTVLYDLTPTTLP